MNNPNASLLNNDTLLVEINDKYAKKLVPVVFYLGVLGFLGFAGNVILFYYYGFRTKITSTSCFILALATFDLLSCTISIPMEIADLSLLFLFTNSSACKICRFVNYFSCFGSGFVLLIIAIDRYRKVCRPFDTQISLKMAVKICMICTLLALVIGTPALVIYTITTVEIRCTTLRGYKEVAIIAHDCTLNKQSEYKLPILLFSILQIIIGLVIIPTVACLYFLIGREIYKMRKFRRQMNRGSKFIGNGHGLQNKTMGASETNKKNHAWLGPSSAIGAFNVKSDKAMTDTENDQKEIFKTPAVVQNSREQLNLRRNKSEQSLTGDTKSQTLDVDTRKYTLMMFVIAEVCTMDFLPYICISIWRVYNHDMELISFTDTQMVLFQIGLRSYFLNCALNPMIYGFFNSKFTAFISNCFCRCQKAL